MIHPHGHCLLQAHAHVQATSRAAILAKRSVGM
jgi:hypothetical protein